VARARASRCHGLSPCAWNCSSITTNGREWRTLPAIKERISSTPLTQLASRLTFGAIGERNREPGGWVDSSQCAPRVPNGFLIQFRSGSLATPSSPPRSSPPTPLAASSSNVTRIVSASYGTGKSSPPSNCVTRRRQMARHDDRDRLLRYKGVPNVTNRPLSTQPVTRSVVVTNREFGSQLRRLSPFPAAFISTALEAAFRGFSPTILIDHASTPLPRRVPGSQFRRSRLRLVWARFAPVAARGHCRR